MSLSQENLVKNSKKFQKLKVQLRQAIKLSLTGITNFVVNYEDPLLIDCFLEDALELDELYKETINIDAVELEYGAPGQGNSATAIDELIFGSIKMSKPTGNSKSEFANIPVPEIDPKTGARLRNNDGFITRPEIKRSKKAKDRTLIIRNIDYCKDFCTRNPGVIDRAVWILDNFRHPVERKGCCLLLVSNIKLELPFSVRVVELPPVDECEAKEVINRLINRYKDSKYEVNFDDSQIRQITRKLCGLIYTKAGDLLASSFSESSNKNDRVIDSQKVVRELRSKINESFMASAVGLTHLSSRPWEDYICPESSNFTYDVKKIARDFGEINFLQDEFQDLSKKNSNTTVISADMEAIRARMPHVILLYGSGGVGKSAFPIHFAGLLDFDVWDFNINAIHDKYVGEGARKMREALSQISRSSHLIVRIDEYDRAIGSDQDHGQGMHSAHRQVESEFMNWLQNKQEENELVKRDIFIILTTNRKESITGPMLRSGRVDLVIDIANFDQQSIKETFLSAPRRMMHKEISLAGFKNYDDMGKAIGALDLNVISEIASSKGFTVKDVDVFLQEMCVHNYYYKKGKGGIQWNTDSFVKVLNGSSGSNKSDFTGELVLGDRFLMEKPKDESQREFVFIAKDSDPKLPDLM